MTDFRVATRDGARAVALGEAGVTAGRAPQCELHLDDTGVSRRHCRFERRDGEVVVTDLDSANGTFVNEQPVRSAIVKPGDVVRIGGTELEIATGAAVPSRRRVDTVLVETDPAHIESIIRKRFQPSQFDWLEPAATTAGPQLALLQRAQRHLSTLHHVSDLLATARDMHGVAEATLRAILDVTAADRAAIVLRRLDPETGDPEVAAARARVATDEPFTVSRALVADVIDKGVSTFANDASADARFSGGESIIAQHVRSVMCVPLRTTGQILGALYADSLSGAGRFTEGDLELMAAIGNQAGVALHRVRLMGELERLLIDTIRAIAATIDAKDGYTHRHSERVAALSKRIAEAMGLPAGEQETVALAALLHDVGKIAVPDSILNKPGTLTPEEFAEMTKHPEHGARILGNIQSATIRAVVPGVKHHHEKWDGTGYPDGLAGEEIPLPGRILGVADFLDALTSTRAYRTPVPIGEAVRMISSAAGTHFDPAIVALVARLHEDGDLLPEGWES
jgi:HD-GYP domain-containing protein (c-di-GMP phosphodiesterase class II)